MDLLGPRIQQGPEAFDLSDLHAVSSNKSVGMNDDVLVFVDEWRVAAPPVVPDFVELR